MDCEKVHYRSRKEAKTAVRRLKQKFKKPHSVYKCSKCIGWHVTSQPAEQSRNVSRALKIRYPDQN